MPVIAAPLAKIFNLSRLTFTFSFTWKMDQIMTIHKNGTIYDITNYRSVSLLSLLSKILEHAINQQVHFETFGPLHNSQHGFGREDPVAQIC